MLQELLALRSIARYRKSQTPPLPQFFPDLVLKMAVLALCMATGRVCGNHDDRPAEPSPQGCGWH